MNDAAVETIYLSKKGWQYGRDKAANRAGTMGGSASVSEGKMTTGRLEGLHRLQSQHTSEPAYLIMLSVYVA